LDLQGLLLAASQFLLDLAVLLGMSYKAKELYSQCSLELLLGLAVEFFLGFALLLFQTLSRVVKSWDRRGARWDDQVDVIMGVLVIF
jgi:hypothetical protein